MIENNIEYSLLKSEDIDQVIDFYNSVHNSERDRAKFEWEFSKSDAGESIYIIARDIKTQKIIGTQAAIPYLLETSGGDLILSAKSEDTLLDSKYRGLKIFDNMYSELILECQKRGICFLWGFTSAIKPFAKIGFEIPFVHSQTVLVFDILNSFYHLSSLNKKNNLFQKLKIFGLSLLSRLKFLFFNTFMNIFYSKQLTYYIGKDLNIINEDILKKMKLKESKLFTLNKSLNFFRWRVTENPYANNSVFIYIMVENKFPSLFVFSSNKDGIWSILDEMYSDELSNFDKKMVLKKAIELLKLDKYNKVDLLRSWEFSHNSFSKKLLINKKMLGLTHVQKGVSFVWLNLSNESKISVKDIVLSKLSSQGMT